MTLTLSADLEARIHAFAQAQEMSPEQALDLLTNIAVARLEEEALGLLRTHKAEAYE